MTTLTLDFETKPITDAVPWPEPVGCAIQVGSRPGRYLAWGHPTGNNASLAEAAAHLREHVREADRVAFFNAPFDVGVARRIGIEVPWDKVEDVQVLAFLADPYAKKRGLKDFAHIELGIAPDERDDLDAWIKAFVPEAKGKRRLGEFIWRAPGDLVGRYARGDTSRTYKLWRHWSRFRGRAYAREMALLPVLEEMTATGIPLDYLELQADFWRWERALEAAETYLRRKIGDVDLDSHDQVADALEKAGLVEEWIETAKGRRSLTYDNLLVLVAEGKFDRAFAHAWGYRSVLVHTLRTFAEPWLAAGAELHPRWNSVKAERDGARKVRGAVTGRLSSEPNVQNIIKRPPKFEVPAGWPELPKMRRYVRAPEGTKLVGVDVSQQELRILADFVGEPLRGWYKADPTLDIHAKVSAEITRVTGLAIGRDPAKTVNLATIYKNGIASMAAKIGCSYEQARTIKHAHARAVPGISKWEKALAAADTFETAGGRVYTHDLERPYKSGNTKIQGSAADQLKQIMIAARGPLAQLDARLVLTAHDEIVALAPERCAVAARHALTQIVEQTGSLVSGPEVDPSLKMFDVPMISSGYIRERWQE